MITRRGFVAFGLAAVGVANGPKVAAQVSKDCLTSAGIDYNFGPEGRKTILVDRTTWFAGSTGEELASRISAWPKGGDCVNVLAFGGRQPELLSLRFDHHFEPAALPDRVARDISVKADIAFKQCAANSDRKGREDLLHVLKELVADPDLDPLGYSPIFEAIRSAGSALMNSKASVRSRSLLLASDGIQHSPGKTSDASSFYLSDHMDRVRIVDIDALIETLAHADLIPPLSGTRVWHVGIAQPSAGDGSVRVRPREESEFLRGFWTKYWKRTGAMLVDLAEPIPLTLE